MSARDVVLTKDDLRVLPRGAIIDATVAGARVRVMRLGADGWVKTGRFDWSITVGLDDLVDAVLVTDAPIQPAPTAPLPLPEPAETEAGA